MTPPAPLPLTWVRLAADDLSALTDALSAARLPAEDVGDPGLAFWRAEVGGATVGFGGLEPCGEDALLRSVVVLSVWRAQGVGRAVIAALEREAEARGVRALYLLTTTAAALFRHLGYVDIPRGDVPRAIRATSQFATLCPQTATILMRRLP